MSDPVNGRFSSRRQISWPQSPGHQRRGRPRLRTLAGHHQEREEVQHGQGFLEASALQEKSSHRTQLLCHENPPQ